jgi:hypothetical protein
MILLLVTGNAGESYVPPIAVAQGSTGNKGGVDLDMMPD